VEYQAEPAAIFIVKLTRQRIQQIFLSVKRPPIAVNKVEKLGFLRIVVIAPLGDNLHLDLEHIVTVYNGVRVIRILA
jgi:hypothetical protein